MAFCENCGHDYKPGKKYCKSCGESLDPTALSFADPTAPPPPTTTRPRQYHNAEASNESLRLYVMCISILSMVQGLALVFGTQALNLLNGQVTTLLIGGAVLATLFKLLFDRRDGISLLRSLTTTLIVGIAIYGIMAIAFIYLAQAVRDTPIAMQNFRLPTPTP